MIVALNAEDPRRIGLGAVLLSRGGTRPMRGSAPTPEPGIYAEETDA